MMGQCAAMEERRKQTEERNARRVLVKEGARAETGALGVFHNRNVATVHVARSGERSCAPAPRRGACALRTVCVIEVTPHAVQVRHDCFGGLHRPVLR